MKTLKQHIQEAFRVNQDYVSKKMTDSIDDDEVLSKIMDILYIKKSLEAYGVYGFKDEDYDDIKKSIYENFVKEYDLHNPDKLMFICRRNQCPKEYIKFYKKDNKLWERYGFGYNLGNTDNTTIWEKKSFILQ